jgi:Integrase core domain.
MITLTMKEEKRLEVIHRVFRGELTVVQAALVLGVSERQCYRVKARVNKVGAKGVVHGNRGRPCKRKIKEKTVEQIVKLAQGKYKGFNDHHLSEKLGSEEKIRLCREKLRQLLRAHGISSPRKRRGPKHRSRRERRAAEGMMLQVDGSPHDWLQGRGPRLCLIGAIDDATAKVMGAFFEEAESSWAYFKLFSQIFKQHGVPQSIYSDRHSVFWTDREPTLEEQLINKRPLTEVGRGLEELGVTLILAGSPQAKGRIERLWGTFQDRLVSELRVARAKTQQQAQKVLERYLLLHNRRFSKPPANALPAWRKVSSLQIEQALCFKERRTVAKDNTITFDGTLFQIPKKSPLRSHANKRIDVHVLLDGAVELFYQNEKIAYFDSKTTHAFGLYRTNGKREGFRYGPISNLASKPHELSP